MFEQIDRELIALIGKRIALLKEAKLQGYVEETADITALLAQFDVPEWVWKNLILGCAATSSVFSLPPVKSRRITIIGGCGQMGRFFTTHFTKCGHQVSILEADDWDDAPELISKAELVLICVPIEVTLTVIQKMAPYLSPSTILADITSCKAGIVSAMLENHTGAVISLHPMFGGSVQSFLSQNVIVCVGRKLESCHWLLDSIESQGGKLIFSTPQEHDRMMSVVQAVRHFATFGLGVFLADEGIDLTRSLDFASSLYRLQIGIVGRLFAGNASLYLNIMLALQERRQLISRLAATYSRLAQFIVEDDRAALEREFEATRCFFQEQGNRSYQESDYLIDSLSVLLAANENESSYNTKNSDLAA